MYHTCKPIENLISANISGYTGVANIEGVRMFCKGCLQNFPKSNKALILIILPQRDFDDVNFEVCTHNYHWERQHEFENI